MADQQMSPTPEPAVPPCKRLGERRTSPRDIAPARDQHDDDGESNLPVTPHMAEAEPVVVAEVVTKTTRHGKTTVLVERCPGQATQVTVVDETDNRKAPPGKDPKDDDGKSEKK